MKKHTVVTSLIASAVVLSASNALADSAATIFASPSGTAVTYDNASGAYPVVTAILSRQGYVSGTHTYSSTSFLAQDSTGSLDLFGLNETATGYSPNVGDAVFAQGTYSPFHQIPEIGSLVNIVHVANAAAPGPLVTTIPALNVATTPQSLAGHLLELDNVLITGAGAGGFFPTYAQASIATETFTITDTSLNSMVFFDWVTSYSTAAAFGDMGMAVPTGRVNMIGFVSVNPGTVPTPEFTAIAITSVPEPATLALCGLGGLLLAGYRQRRKA